MMTTSKSIQNPLTASAELLYLPHIASWQIPEKPAVSHRIVAALPALQRGAVWKPQQIEALWDSIVRGFPIGAFMLSPYDEARGRQPAKHQQEGVASPNYHLLDGQQRSTAVALGFLNPWSSSVEAKAVLWIDVATPHEGSDLEFVFRVLTRSHPWGYKRTEPGSPITVGHIRASLEAYRAAAPEHQKTRPAQFPLTHVWPWDAVAPIPLPLLVEEILRDDVPPETLGQRLLERMKGLPFWKEGQLDWQLKVKSMLDGHDLHLTPRFMRLVDRLCGVLPVNGSYGVPVLVIPHITRADAVKDGQQDPVETLFIRVNQSGTRLEGEELIYSILKSNWPEAPVFINKMENKLATPSRLLLFSTRLVLAQMQKKDTERPPAVTDVGQFRRLIHGLDKIHPDFRQQLESFVREDGVVVFNITNKLLTDVSLPAGKYALPTVLATELAQKWPESLFLLLRWVVRMRTEGLDPLQIKPLARRRMLGFLTAMAWFASDRAKSLAAVWLHLQKMENNDLPDFFSSHAFSMMLTLDEKDSLQMRPLPPPDVLAKVIRDRVTSGRGSGGYGGFGDTSHEFWLKWNRWEWMSQKITGDLSVWYQENFQELWQRAGNENEEALRPDSKYQESWSQFINELWNKRSVLLYAQRDWLMTWFPDYDPSQPDQLEDMNRPWDYDHIHPQRYLKNDAGNSQRNIPNIIRDWHGSIGNFRAWPLEANRADSDTSPAIKLSEVSETEHNYGMHSSKDERSASVVGDVDWEHWQKSVPQIDAFPRQYLARPSENGYGSCRKELIYAITKRFVALYREWYESLEVGALMQPRKSESS